ncbi:MAG: division/cell wall cluster transcriptional repressor MraZ [Polyangiales bacterium]
MFRGRFEHSVDKKGRVSVPARFREVLASCGESKLVITTGLENCLVAYPMTEWMRFEERLNALPQFDRNVSKLKRIYVSGAVECDLDKMGRVLVPATLRKHASLDRDVLWAGMGNYMELWSTTAFDALTDSVLGDDEEKQAIADRLAELGL